jgi:CRP-like cAMP-binding protein
MVSNAVVDSARSGVDPSLLSAVDEEELGRLRALFETVRPAAGAILARAGEPFEYLYFPRGAIVSMVVRLRDGETVEAGLVGDEGLVGMNLFWGGNRALITALVQVGGEIDRVRVDAIRDRLDEFPTLARAASRYGSTLLVTVAQVAACNATHNLRQRMARWLLMAHDRAGRDRFRLTHEFIATMINVRRAGVSQFASELRGAGAIAYTRGEVQIVNRAKLEAEACECYDVIRRQTLAPQA